MTAQRKFIGFALLVGLFAGCGTNDSQSSDAVGGSSNRPPSGSSHADEATPALPTQVDTGDTVTFATTTSVAPTTSTTSTTSTVAPPTTEPPLPVRCTLSGDTYFEPGSSIPVEMATEHISSLLSSLTDIVSVSVEGHTDWRDDDITNHVLSAARALAIAAIVRQFVPETVAISSIGVGETYAHQDSPTEAQMATDRRVDLLIVATFPPGTPCSAHSSLSHIPLLKGSQP